MAKPTAKTKGKKEKKEFLDDLVHSFSGVDNRTKLDRYREFQKVFLGSEEGKRVLHDILGFAKLSAPIAPPFPEPVDEKRMMILEGGRELAIKILEVLHKEPITDRPTQTKRRPK